MTSDSYGHGWDAGYSAGRAEALGSGAQGLLDEIAHLRKTLAVIGRHGKPLPSSVMKRMAREALDRTATMLTTTSGSEATP